MAPNPNYNSMLATTLAKFENKLSDNIFLSRAFSFWLMKGGRFENADGGEKYVAQLQYAQNGTWMTYSGMEGLDVTDQDPFTAAEYPWREAALSVVMSGLDEAKNSGSATRMINLLDSKVTNAIETGKEKFNQMFLTSDGTGNSGKDFFGLPYLVGNETNIATVGGIDCTQAANAFWRSKVFTGADASLATATLSSDYDSVKIGNDKPDFEITTALLWETFESKLVTNVRYEDKALANAGFDNILHRNTPVVWDEYIPAKTWYYLNSKYLKLVSLAGIWLKQKPFVSPEDKDGQVALILSKGQLITNNRRMLAVRKNLIP